MELFVVPSLMLHVVLNGFFISRSSDGVDVEARCPECAAPEELLEFRVTIEDFPCCDAFDGAGDLGGREQRNGLDEEMNVIFIRTDFDEDDFVVLSDCPTDVFQRFLDWFCEDLLSVFDGADQMVEEKRDIVGFPLMLAHGSMLLRE